MSRSVADWDLDRLSARARETLERIAGPHADGVTLEEIAEQLGLPKREISKRLGELRDELDAQHAVKHGATVRALSDSEYETLKDSIRGHGQLVPALVDPATGELLDGHNRQRACAELDLELWTIPLRPSGDSAHDLALAINYVRRHLTSSDRRRAIAAELMLNPDRSDRQIAALVGTTHPTVAAVRRELERHGQVERFTTRVGSDGKRQVAAKARTAPTSSAPSEPGPDDGRLLTRLDYIELELRALTELDDRSHAHAKADELVSEALRLAGLGKIAAAYQAGRWWQ